MSIHISQQLEKTWLALPRKYTSKDLKALSTMKSSYQKDSERGLLMKTMVMKVIAKIMCYQTKRLSKTTAKTAQKLRMIQMILTMRR